MANLTKNLELLQTGKQKIIDKINSKLAEKDQKKLEVTCLWEEINTLLAKVKIKKDRSDELDTSEIYSEICDDTRNRDIITNVTSVGSYSLYNQQYLPKLVANSCVSIGQYALYGCTALSVVELENCKTIESYAFANTTSLKQISLPKLTSCEPYAFQNSGIETVSLDSVTTIDNYAFQEAKELTYVNAPKVVSVASYTFYNDAKLKEVSTNTTEVAVSSYAFYNCSSFDDEIFISKVKSCGAYSFYNNAFLTINNDKLTTLSSANYCFTNCSKLESVTLENCTNINAYQIFSSLPKLHSLNLPKVTILGRYNWNNYSDSAIHTCAELESLYLPELTQTYSLCYNCANLTRVSLPKIKYVYYDSAFITDCPKLEIIDMPETIIANSRNVTNYNDQGLFKNLYNLKTINLPKLAYTYQTGTTTYNDQSYFGQSLFYRCGMTKLTLPSFKYFNPRYCGFIVNDCRNLTTLELPQLEQVRSNSNYGLQIIVGCPKLEVLELPALTNIHAYRAFCCADYHYNSSQYNGYYYYSDSCQCKSYITTMLRAIRENYPDTFETRSDYIQYYERLNGGTTSSGLDTTDPYSSGRYSAINYNMVYSGLKVLKLPKLTSWTNGWYMIDSCTELEEIWLGDGTFAATSSLGSNFCYRCYNLKKIVLNYTSVVNATTSLLNIFNGSTYYLTGDRRSLNYNNKTYYYINELAEKSFKIYVPDDLVEAYKTASNWATYADNIFPISDLAGKTIDPSITAIADNEFKDDTTLTNIVGLGIESIGKYSFANSSLTWAEFAHCYSVDDYAFANATELSRLVLRYNDITTIGKGAFMNTKLSNMVLNKLGIVSDELFNNCAMLTSVSLPVAKIVGKNSFENSGLTSITLPEALKIDNQAFNNCSMLTGITLNKATIIGESAFENTGIAALSLPLVTTIQRTAFKNSALTTVDLPKIMIVGDEAFANNTSLTTINLYEAMQIGSNVFDGCTALTDITFTGYTVPVCGNLPETCTLHVRTEVVDDYKLTFPNNVVVGDVA